MQRIFIVDAIRYVDYTVIADYDNSVEPSILYENDKQREWLIMFESIFDVLRPNTLYYELNPTLQTAREKAFEEYGIQGVHKKRGESISTSKIVSKLANLS